MRLHLTVGRLALRIDTEPDPEPGDPIPDNAPTPMEIYVPDHEDETTGFRMPTARKEK